MIWDGAGSVVARRQFEPHGQVVADWWSEVTDTRYAGHRLNVSTGLHDFGARWYDSATGSFMSVDPLIADLIDPQQHNPYAYARGNPLKFNDPTGLFSDLEAGLNGGGGSTSIFIAGGDTGPVGVSGSTNIADMFSGRGPGLGSAATPESSSVPFQVLGTEARIGALGSIDFSNQVSPAAPQQSQSPSAPQSTSGTIDFETVQKAVGVTDVAVGGLEAALEAAGKNPKGLSVPGTALGVASVGMDGVQMFNGIAQKNPGKATAGAIGIGVGVAVLKRGAPGLLAVDGALQVFDSSIEGAVNHFIEKRLAIDAQFVRECQQCLLFQGF